MSEAYYQRGRSRVAWKVCHCPSISPKLWLRIFWPRYRKLVDSV